MVFVWVPPAAGAGGCPDVGEVVGCPVAGCWVPVEGGVSVVVCAGGFSVAAGCSGVFSGSGSGLEVLGSICIFSAIGCSRSGGG